MQQPKHELPNTRDAGIASNGLMHCAEWWPFQGFLLFHWGLLIQYVILWSLVGAQLDPQQPVSLPFYLGSGVVGEGMTRPWLTSY